MENVDHISFKFDVEVKALRFGKGNIDEFIKTNVRILSRINFNTWVVKVLGTPVGDQGGSLWTLTQKTHFPKEFFDQTRYLSRLL